MKLLARYKPERFRSRRQRSGAAWISASSDLLAQRLKQRIHGSVLPLEKRNVVTALGQPQAYPANDDIDDPQLPGIGADHPVDMGWRIIGCPRNDRRHLDRRSG